MEEEACSAGDSCQSAGRSDAGRRLLLRWANAALAKRGLEMGEGSEQDPHVSALLLHLLELAHGRLPARLSGHCLRPATQEAVAANEHLLRLHFPAMPEPFPWDDKDAVVDLLEAIAARCTKVSGFPCASAEELEQQVLQHVNETFSKMAITEDEERLYLTSPGELAGVISDAETFWRFVLLHCDDPHLAEERLETAEDMVERAMQLAQSRLGVTPLLTGSELLEVGKDCGPLLLAIFLAEFYKFNVLPCYDDSEKLSKEFTECLDGIFRRLERLRCMLGRREGPQDEELALEAVHEVETLQDDLLLMGAAYEQILQHSERPYQEWNAMLAAVQRVVATPLPPGDSQEALSVLSRAVLVAAENVQCHALSMGLVPREEADTLLEASSVLGEVLGEETPLKRSRGGSWMPVQPPALRARREEQQKRIAELEKELEEAKQTIAQLQGRGAMLLEDLPEEEEDEESVDDARTLRLRNKALNKMNRQLKAQLKKHRSFQEGVVGLVEGLLVARPASMAHTALQKENSKDWKDALAALHERKAQKRGSRLVLTSRTAVTATAPVAAREQCAMRPLSPRSKKRTPNPENGRDGAGGQAAAAAASVPQLPILADCTAAAKGNEVQELERLGEEKQEEAVDCKDLHADDDNGSAEEVACHAVEKEVNEETDSAETVVAVQWTSKSPRRHLLEGSSAVLSPAVASPAVTSPALPSAETPPAVPSAVASPADASPADFSSADASPADASPADASPTVASPAVASPAVASPTVASPAVASPSDGPRWEPSYPRRPT